MEFLNSQRTEQNSEEIDRAIEVAKKKLKEGLKGIRDEMEKEFAGQENTFLKMLLVTYGGQRLPDRVSQLSACLHCGFSNPAYTITPN